MPKFSNDLFDKVCERIASGESLKSISRDSDMPSQTAVYNWLNADPALVEKYMRAREYQADSIFDEILMISDTPVVGRKVRIDKDGNEEITEGDMIEHRRLQVDARKWMAGKLAPKKYGDKLAIGGADDLPPIEMKSELSDKEIARRVAFLLAAGLQGDDNG